MTDYERFEKFSDEVRRAGATLLVKYFGERCDDHDHDCVVCQRWKALDAITENPFERD